MPVNHVIWKVGLPPERLQSTSLKTESLLEEMICRDPKILSDRWMIVGSQVPTVHGGFIDLLALNQDGQLIVVELKRDRTPREVVAQAIDYASWVQSLTADEIAAIYDRFSKGDALDVAFRQRFGIDLDEEQLNGSHQVVIVAARLDPSTERIVSYLNAMDVPINAVFFQVFENDGTQYLSRAWFIDPVETEAKAGLVGGGRKGEWNGEFYVSFGHGDSRTWQDAREFGFISAGGGRWYSGTLQLLSEGARVWVNVPGYGYVGVGRVVGPPMLVQEFTVNVDGVRRGFLEVAGAAYHRDRPEEEAEYVVPVQWEHTVPLEEAVSEVGFFGNQNSVCRPRIAKWNHTIDRLKKSFPVSET